jgi:hypothetical protein
VKTLFFEKLLSFEESSEAFTVLPILLFFSRFMFVYSTTSDKKLYVPVYFDFCVF